MDEFIIGMMALKGDLTAVNKWQRTGLLKKLNETEARVCAYYFESIAFCITHESFVFDKDDPQLRKLSNMLFPIQRRIFPRQLRINQEGTIGVESMGRKFSLSWGDIGKRIEQIIGDIPNCWGGLDAEVELVKLLADDICREVPCVPMWGLRVDR